MHPSNLGLKSFITIDLKSEQTYLIKMLLQYLYDFWDYISGNSKLDTYVSRLPNHYLRELVYCNGEIKPCLYDTVDLYKLAVAEYITKCSDIESEKEFHEEFLGIEIDDNECVSILDRITKSPEFETEVSKLYYK